MLFETEITLPLISNLSIKILSLNLGNSTSLGLKLTNPLIEGK